MDPHPALSGAQLRVARPPDNLNAVVHFFVKCYKPPIDNMFHEGGDDRFSKLGEEWMFLHCYELGVD
jgi:hypothetical protein